MGKGGSRRMDERKAAQPLSAAYTGGGAHNRKAACLAGCAVEARHTAILWYCRLAFNLQSVTKRTRIPERTTLRNGGSDGPEGSLSYEQPKAVVNAPRAEEANPTIDTVWDALSRAGGKGSIHKLAAVHGRAGGSAADAGKSAAVAPRHTAGILAFADQAASTARERISDGLIACRQEGDSPAGDNERLSAEVDALRVQLARRVRKGCRGGEGSAARERTGRRSDARDDERAAAERAYCAGQGRAAAGVDLRSRRRAPRHAHRAGRPAGGADRGGAYRGGPRGAAEGSGGTDE